jgi:hypothetical protein
VGKAEFRAPTRGRSASRLSEKILCVGGDRQTSRLSSECSQNRKILPMTLELVGFVTVAVGLLCLFVGPRLLILAMPFASLLGASAATVLTALGGANIPPAHVLLGFGALTTILRYRLFGYALQAIAFPLPGFWLAVTILYGLATAIFIPRLFAGQTDVFAIARTETSGVLVLVPLQPVSGNFTQSIYFVADLVCFMLYYSYAQSEDNVRLFAKAVLACAIANLVFGLIDYLTFTTGTAELLAPIRNGTYAILDEAELAGFKRIVGSFAEASSYGTFSLWLFAFAGKLWLRGIYTRTTGPLALLLIFALLASTSTTAYAGFAIILAIEYIAGIVRIALRQATWTTAFFLMFAPMIFGIFACVVALHPTWSSTVWEVYEITFLNKLSSDSGIERSSWNMQAATNLVETFGLGVGVGSTRTSTWLLAVPVSLGIVGTLTYGAFVLSIFLLRPCSDSFGAGVKSAARSACLAQLIGSCIGGAFVDLGLPFFMLAAVALAPQTGAKQVYSSSPVMSQLGALASRNP